MYAVQISTSAGWDGVLDALMNEDKCERNVNDSDVRPRGDCGDKGQAVVYIVTYLIISFLVVINMYIAVILENFSQVMSSHTSVHVLVILTTSTSSTTERGRIVFRACSCAAFTKISCLNNNWM